jgi:hypothetical protein
VDQLIGGIDAVGAFIGGLVVTAPKGAALN